MPLESNARIDHARSASGDELKSLVHDAAGELLLALLENPHLQEPHVATLLERLDLPTSVLGAVALDGKWMSKEGIRFRLAKHPRTPERVALAVVRQFHLFDLVRLSLMPSAPAAIRRVSDELILSRLPQLPLGEKLALARRGPSRVAGAILAEGHTQATKLVLANPYLTESQILKVLANASTPESVVVAIAQHAKWPSRYNVGMALARHSQTPAASVLALLPDITLRDLKGISRLEGLASHLKKYIAQELARRTAGADRPALKRAL
jgi:hypothetical protein